MIHLPRLPLATPGARSELAAPAEPRGSSVLRLFRFERRWLLRIFESLLPSGADARLPLGAVDLPMGRFADDLLEHAPIRYVWGLRACMWILMLAPPLVLGRMHSFLGLSALERVSLVDRLARSEIYIVREAPLLLKISACLGFCGVGSVQRAVGIHPTDATPPSWAVERPGAEGRES